MKFKQTLIGFGALLCTVSTVQARTVQWGGYDPSYLYQSNGTSLIDGSFTFLLGTFDDGFNPATEGLDTWASNWHTFDEADFNVSTQFFSGEASMLETGFSDSTDPSVDADYDFRNKSLYLWVFNSNTFNPLEPTTIESALFRGASWVMPNEYSCCGEELPLQFFIDSMDTAIIGNVDPEFDGDPIVGPLGSYTPPVGLYDFQTHSFTIVPEPSVTLIGAVGVLGFVLRRRRK